MHSSLHVLCVCLLYTDMCFANMSFVLKNVVWRIFHSVKTNRFGISTSSLRAIECGRSLMPPIRKSLYQVGLCLILSLCTSRFCRQDKISPPTMRKRPLPRRVAVFSTLLVLDVTGWMAVEATRALTFQRTPKCSISPTLNCPVSFRMAYLERACQHFMVSMK